MDGHYPDQGRDGVIVCIKPTLVDGDPADVLGYRNSNRHFPHDTTANQWFDEAHFENYRALGRVSGEAARQEIRDALNQIGVR